MKKTIIVLSLLAISSTISAKEFILMPDKFEQYKKHGCIANNMLFDEGFIIKAADIRQQCTRDTFRRVFYWAPLKTTDKEQN